MYIIAEKISFGVNNNHSLIPLELKTSSSKTIYVYKVIINYLYK
jgi:hypothetical protein